MKKNITLILVVIMIALLTGCGKTETKEQTTICKKQESTHLETITLSGTNGKISRLDVIYEYEASVFGIDSFENISDELKQEFINNMYTNLGFEKDKTYDGFNIKIELKDKVIVSYGGDINSSSAQTQFKKLDIDFKNADLTYKNAVESYKTNGYTCN